MREPEERVGRPAGGPAAGRLEGMPAVLRPRRPEDFDAIYAGTPPWETGRPQPAFVALAEAGAFRGRVLDVGCGTVEHALLAASLGLEATGIDIAAAAIERAREKAKQRGLTAGFLVGTSWSWPGSASGSTPCSTPGCSTSSRTATARRSWTACGR